MLIYVRQKPSPNALRKAERCKMHIYFRAKNESESLAVRQRGAKSTFTSSKEQIRKPCSKADRCSKCTSKTIQERNEEALRKAERCKMHSCFKQRTDPEALQ
jgi:hypothetical protein